MSEDLSKQIKKDIKLSVLTGPLTVIIPILSYIFLYPIILYESNIEVLGLWSLYVTTATFFSVADIGFSQHFIREANEDISINLLKILKEELISARRFYLFLGIAAIVIVIIINKTFFVYSDNIYPSSGLFFSALILIIGATIQLISSLDAAILSARADNYFVRIIRSTSPVFNYSIAVIGAIINMPIEGFSIGYLISNLFLLIMYRLRFGKKHKNWHSIKISISIKQSLKSLKALLKKSWQLYSVSIGMLIRQPVIRYILAVTLGLSSVGAFDIAIRVTTAFRDVVATGFSSLFPSFSFFYKKNDKSNIINVIRVSLYILIPAGVISAIILIFYSEFIYTLWLKEIPTGAVLATIILSIWQLMTLINIPFWYLLLASNNEKIAAISIWVHTLCILFIIPASIIGIEFTLYSLLVYWTLTAVLTQILIYYFIEKKLSLLKDILIHTDMIVIISSSIIYFILSVFTIRIFQTEFGIPHPEILVLTIIFLVGLTPFYFNLFKRSRYIK